MNRLGFAVLLLAGVVVVPTAVSAQAFAMFPSQAVAEKRARELKCSGVFAMGKDWMPCQNSDAYQDAVSKEK